MNLEELTLAELKNLRKKVSKMIDTYEEREKTEALSKVTEMAKSMGFTIEQLLGQNPIKAVRKAAIPKYCHPENSEITWSGRGRKPIWFVAALENGISAEDLLIK
jgi:DNA-binding protein H-NS